eukprot:scaffold2295_cov354-Prasinococcus_capsulatus_cf.AAC.23
MGLTTIHMPRSLQDASGDGGGAGGPPMQSQTSEPGMTGMHNSQGAIVMHNCETAPKHPVRLGSCGASV